MKRLIVVLFLGVLSASTMAHEWTPTYPKLGLSHLKDIWVTKMKLFNNREDINYYEINVYDNEWNPVPFAVTENPIKIDYQTRKIIDVYIRNKDKDRAVYICSKSKPLASDTVKTMMFSRICSKIK